MPQMPVLYHVRRRTVFVGDSRKRGGRMTDREQLLQKVKKIQAFAPAPFPSMVVIYNSGKEKDG